MSNLFEKHISDHPIVASLAVTAAAVVGTAAYLATKPRPLKFPFDLENQSIVLDKDEGIRGSTFVADGKPVDSMYPDATTMYENVIRGMQLSNDGPCLGSRRDGNSPYEWIKYSELVNQAQCLGSGYITLLNQIASNETFVGIYSKNCKEWVISEQACFSYSMTTVPLYDTLGADACTYIINQTEMELLICESDSKTRELLEKMDDIPKLKYIVVLFDLTENTRSMGGDRVKVFSFNEVLEHGKNNLQSVKPPKPSDIATVCYTSGTTGKPKGVVIAHENLMSSINGSILLFTQTGALKFSPDDVYISYLPLAHMLERSAQAFIFMHGGRVGFFRGNIQELVDDIQVLQPTLFCTVPRLLNRFYDKVQGQVQGNFLKRKLLDWAVASKFEEIKKGIIRRDSIWDYLVFNKIQKSFGGKIRILITGSAPLSETVLTFCRAALGCFIFEAYGQTEASSAVTCTLLGEYRSGIVGPPLPNNLVKLIDVPDMGIEVKRDGRGEVCVKGSNCTVGYYKESEKTKEIIDQDGWLHTGDIGLWTSYGALKIVDRCKNMFKLSQGEYISPDKIESCYIQSSHVAQVFVDGNSLRSCTVALVYPDLDNIVRTLNKETDHSASEKSVAWDINSICNNANIKRRLLVELNQLGKGAGLKGFEQIKGLHLINEPFSIENGLMTPTMKLKRHNIRQQYAEEIENIYKLLDN